jgi:ubiquinone/menaquinone biosynthesis C-methylase UbiE
MKFDPAEIIRSYTDKAEEEDQAEKELSLRTEIPREFIKRYIQPSDRVLDAGGGTGANAILMAEQCESVTLLDLTPKILQLARQNIQNSGLEEKIRIVEGDICRLEQFDDGKFSMVVCVGDALSYSLDQRQAALKELVRVAEPGATLILGCDSKFGFLRLALARGEIDEARQILASSETYCGMGPRTHLYTVDEMQSLLAANGCQVLEIAATPSLADTFDVKTYLETGLWDDLKAIELQICTQPELLGVGLHLLFVAQKA